MPDPIGALIDQLTGLEKTVTPRTPSRPCVCCGTATATHGNRDGTPSDCWHCWTYMRRAGYRCDEAIHAVRPPETRMCECPQGCCDVCPDRAAEGRRLSDRCRKRKERGTWQAA